MGRGKVGDGSLMTGYGKNSVNEFERWRLESIE